MTHPLWCELEKKRLKVYVRDVIHGPQTVWGQILTTYMELILYLRVGVKLV